MQFSDTIGQMTSCAKLPPRMENTDFSGNKDFQKSLGKFAKLSAK